MKTINMFKYILLLFSCMCFISCKKYLDEKPDKGLVIPSTLADCDALINNYSVMNTAFPVGGEAMTDNYFISDAAWLALLFQEDKSNYIWMPKAPQRITQWSSTYTVVFYANVILETLNKIKPISNEQITWNKLKGSSLFFRAMSFFQLAQLYMKPYNANNASQELGIPLRLSPDIDLKTSRSTMKETYDRILQDLHEAVDFLPNVSTNKALPNKTAAFGMLARIYLSMEDYSKAGTYADSCLKRYDVLLDYNQLNSSSNAPFTIFNDEVIFQSRVLASALLTSTQARVDKDLYLSYHGNDLRKVLFFRSMAGNTFSFKGDYGGNNSQQFNGLSTDEQYLIRAECNARAGNKDLALSDLNKLLKSRWKTLPTGSTFVDYTASNADAALELILQERRKELLFRHLRWSDLRRLNKDPRFAKTLQRTLNGQTYQLPPNDIRYTLMIPQDIIDKTGIQQN